MSENTSSCEQVWAVPGSIGSDSNGVPRLMAGQCAQCHMTCHPCPSVCPGCWSDDIETIMLPRIGRLYSYSVVHAARPGWDTPYLLGAVDFPELDARVVGVLKGPADWRPALDTPMRVEVGPICRNEKGDTVYAHQFVPDK